MVGKLQRVPLRNVWIHEAHDFTRWLQDNLDVLSDAVDFELSSAEREQSAGTFSVDLLAEDDSGNQASFTTLVFVGIHPPFIDSPDNIEIVQGDEAYLTWAPRTPAPDSFIITMTNGWYVESTWLGGNIALDLSELAPGYYDVTLLVNDTQGLTQTDIVTITVLYAEGVYPLPTISQIMTLTITIASLAIIGILAPSIIREALSKTEE